MIVGWNATARKALQELAVESRQRPLHVAVLTVEDKMAVEKCPGKDVTLDWRWWLTAHAGTHGFVVACLTGIPLLGVAEMIAHSLIDFGKCRLGYKMIVDQMLHWTCKFIWMICVMGIR